MFSLMRCYIQARIKVWFLLVGTRCPASYPYAFMWGAYCCKTAVECYNDRLRIPISLHSVCCEHSDYQHCSSVEGCKSNRGIFI